MKFEPGMRVEMLLPRDGVVKDVEGSDVAVLWRGETEIRWHKDYALAAAVSTSAVRASERFREGSVADLPKGWVEGYEVIVYGQNEDGQDVAQTEGPFRTRADASAFAKAKYKGFTFNVVITLVETKYTRFKKAPAQVARSRKARK